MSALIIALALACVPRGSPGSDTGWGAVEALSDLRIAQSAAMPAVIVVEWTSTSPCAGRVELGLDGDYDRWVPAESDDGHTHRAQVVGLKAGRSYALRPVASCGGGIHRGEEHWVTMPETPWDMPRMDVHASDLQATSSGYVIAAQMQAIGSWVVVLDQDWDYVWYWNAGPVNVLTTHIARDGSGIFYAQNSHDQSRDVGATTYVPWDGIEPRVTCNQMGHHASIELPDGQLGFLSLDLREEQVHGESVLVAGDAVLETGLHAVSCDDHDDVFNFFDHWSPEDLHSEEFDTLTIAGGADWTHANSLLYDEQDDAYLVMARNMDAVVKVDRPTGEVLWQMGGEGGDFAFDDPQDRWSHGHTSSIGDGEMLVFDNGNGRVPQRSRVARYRFDEVAMTVHMDWEHWEPEGGFVQFAGDAAPLPGGNVLISWGSLGRLTEMEGARLVRQADMPLGSVLGRVEWVESLGDHSPIER